jgi:hypothetical protein
LLAHPRHSDPVLAELNDFIFALQVLHYENPQAEELMQSWMQLRDVSWRIRELTDGENLLISDSRVKTQIVEVRKRRTIRFELARQVQGKGLDAPVLVGEGMRRLVLVEVHNPLDHGQHVEISGEKSEILFWKKSFDVEAGETRLTFAHAAPTTPGNLQNTLTLRAGHDRVGTATIRAEVAARHHDAPRTPDRAIQFRVRDAETGAVSPVRIEVIDPEGKPFTQPLFGGGYVVQQEHTGHWKTPLWPLQTGPYFYIDGVAVLGVEPKGKTARIYKGFEYLPETVEIPEDGKLEVEMKRWINMPALGWYSGQTHIHTTDQGMPVPFWDGWPLVAQAEDLAVSNILTLKGEWDTVAIYANEYPMGVIPVDHPESHLIVYGEEYRNNPYGHLCFLGLDELIEPISSGALGELGGPDYPPNAFVLESALNQGAATVGAHFGLSILGDEGIQTRWPSTGYEMPVDVALGKIEISEIYGNGGQLDVWYKLLNCGFEIAATAGPDWFIKDTPRVYVDLGSKPLTFEAWKWGLQKGRSFITRGPMLFVSVNGEKPGARLHLEDRPAKVRVSAKALLPGESLPVEILVNGQVVASGKDFDGQVELTDSSWVAVRTEDAHSNPVYVTLGGRPRGFAEPAEEFLGVSGRLRQWVQTKALFDTEAQKESVLEVIEEGERVYRAIVERARRLGR